MMKTDVIQLDEKSAEDFLRLRIELLSELGEIDEYADISQRKSSTEQYFLSHINKDLFSWGISAGGRLASIGSLCLFTRIPYEENLSGAEGYILNIYTLPEFRKRGLADRILDRIIEYSRESGIKKLWLNSSDQGRRLYAEKGFKEKDNEMELFL